MPSAERDYAPVKARTAKLFEGRLGMVDYPKVHASPPMAVGAQPRIVSFDKFTADLRLKELRRDGVPIKLRGQPFAVLAMLIERPGEVVTREELRAHLWTSETFVDFDHSLNVAVNRIREALCDSSERPLFVETVPRIGYRFIAKVNGGGLTSDTAAEAGARANSAEAALQAEPPAIVPQSLARPTTGNASPEFGERAAVRRRQILWYAAVMALLAVGLAAVYAVRRGSHEAASAPHEKIMLAVLPFENLTGDPANEYFSDGLTEEMITQLATMQPERLGVIARTSVMGYKHGDRSVSRVGSQLGVQYILEGSLRQSSGRVRITAQLIQVKDQTHLWAEDYDRDLGDVLTLEREVSANVAREIQLELTSQQNANIRQPRPVDPEAHELFLKGCFFWNKRTIGGFKKAVEYFQAAIDKEPDYAEAYAGLADAYRFQMNELPPEEVMPKARSAAEKALSLNPNLAEAHASLGLIIPYFDWDWESARKHFERAIELNPNYATAHQWYGEAYLTPMGRIDESLAEIRVARQLDPLSCAVGADVGKTLYFARRYDESISQLRSVLDMDSTCYPAYAWLRQAYEAKGRYAQALQVFEKEKEFASRAQQVAFQVNIHARMGQTLQARQFQAQLLELAQTEPVDPGLIAAEYINLGDKEQAFAWLEKAYAARSNFMSSLKVWGLYDPLRNDPRFVDLERRVKLIP